MVSKRYPEYPIEEIGDSTNAFVTRALSLGDDNKFSEEWSMYVSTYDKKKRFVNIIGKSVHELIHLLRFNGIVDGDKESKIRDGVSIARCNKETKSVKRKHYNLEEGIVQRYTNQALDMLHEFIASEKLPKGSLLARFKNDYPKKLDLRTLCKYKLLILCVETDYLRKLLMHLLTKTFPLQDWQFTTIIEWVMELHLLVYLEIWIYVLQS